MILSSISEESKKEKIAQILHFYLISLFSPGTLYPLIELFNSATTGARMFYNAHEMMLRRKLEEHAELQKAIELQGRRLMNLQLPNFKSDRIYHHQRSMSVGSPVALPTQVGNSSFTLVSDDSDQKTKGLLRNVSF